MTDQKARLKKGLENILENLEVTGEAVILDKDGNVKRRLKIRRVKLKEEDSNATSDSTSE
jgi:hypothetical protein